MNPIPNGAETPWAVFSFLEPRLLEQRYHPGVFLSDEVLRASQGTRGRLCAPEPCAVMAVFPAGMTMDMGLANRDHFLHERVRSNMLALAVVADTSDMLAVSKLYFAYFRQAFPVKVFDEERDALRWLRERLRELTGVV